MRKCQGNVPDGTEAYSQARKAFWHVPQGRPYSLDSGKAKIPGQEFSRNKPKRVVVIIGGIKADLLRHHPGRDKFEGPGRLPDGPETEFLIHEATGTYPSSRG
jgi:hypothetical protein